MNDLKPTPAADFRHVREHGVTFELHTGRVIRMRNTDPGLYTAELATMPPMLREFIAKLMRGADADLDIVEEFLKVPEKSEKLQEYLISLDIVAAKALLSPWMTMPKHEKTVAGELARYDADLMSASVSVNNFMAGRSVARQNEPEIARDPGARIDPQDMELDEKRTLFRLAWLSAPVLARLATIDFSTVAETQPQIVPAQPVAIPEKA